MTSEQEQAAAKLRAKRPMSIPGTNAIISRTEAREWHREVLLAAQDLNIGMAESTEFFDLCGVAD